MTSRPGFWYFSNFRIQTHMYTSELWGGGWGENLENVLNKTEKHKALSILINTHQDL